MNKNLLNQIYKMYGQIQIGTGDICLKCKKHAKNKKKELTQGPVPILHVGKDFDKNGKRLLFIGLVAYGWNDKLGEVNETWSKINNNDFETIKKTQDAIETRMKELFNGRKGKVKYLNAIKQATVNIFGDSEKAFDRIAISNFVHCNSNIVKDSLPQYVRKSCSDINKLGLVFKEIKILNPTHIVVLTKDNKYTRYLPEPDGYKLLKVGHPSRGSRSDFIEKVGDFYND